MRTPISWLHGSFSLISMLVLLMASMPGLASNGDENKTTYYGVENDPDRSTSANDSAAGVKLATGSTADLPVLQNRTGAQILADLDKLVTEHGKDGKLAPGLFVFHYSGHGGAVTPEGPAFIGRRGGLINTDDLVDKLLQIVGEGTTALILVDACGAGNLKNSLDSKIGDEDGKRLDYLAVMGTRKMEPADGDVCPRQGPVSIGEKVKDGLSMGGDGKAKADKNKDGTVTMTELVEYTQAEGDGFSTAFFGSEEGLNKAVTGTSLVNGSAPAERAKAESTDPLRRAASGSSDSIRFDADGQTITFTEHFFVDTGHSGDPLIGAELLIPQMVLHGELLPGEFLFQAIDPHFRVVESDSELITALLDTLIFDANRNTFEGPLKGLRSSPGFSSPWLDEALGLLDPSSLGFTPGTAPFFTYKPDVEFLASTLGWSADASATGSDGIRIAYRVPSPGTLALVGIGLFFAWSIERAGQQRRRGNLGRR